MLVAKKKLRYTLGLTAIAVLSFNLVGCSDSAVKRDLPAPPVSDKFAVAGHIETASTVETNVYQSSAIPGVVDETVPVLPSFNGIESNNYSVTAVNVPAKDLFYQIAKDAGRDIDLFSGIEGNVTVNAINQPLEVVLERIADQVGLLYEVDDQVIKIRPDVPGWRNYRVDYVNISKSSTDSIDMKMSVSGGTVSASAAGGSAGSSAKVTVSSGHDFWKQLETNILQLAQLDPFTLKNIKAAGEASETGVAQNTVINPEAGVVSVYTTGKKHKAIKRYIEDIVNRASRQVLIEATVVEVALNDRYQAGIDWTFMGMKSGGGVGVSSPFQGGAGDDGFTIKTLDPTGVYGGIVTGEWGTQMGLSLLKEFGDSKVLSSPKIMAINNQTALLKVVENLVYFTVDVNTTTSSTAASTTTYETEIHTVPIGFMMSVTPFVSDGDEVTLYVRPTITDKIGEVQDPNPALKNAGVVSPIPVIQEREMSSVLKLKDKQTAIIGGLIKDKNHQVRNGLPWLSDIPWVGDLFSSRDDQTVKSELVIFIRPVIVNKPDVDRGDLKPMAKFLKSKQN